MNKYKKPLKAIFIIIAVIFAAWAITPFFLDNEVDEAAPENSQAISRNETDSAAPAVEDDVTGTEPAQETSQEDDNTRTGRFEGRNNYSADGSVTLIQDDKGVRYVRFEDNFEASNGPDLRVHIGTEDDRGIDIGALKGNIGGQNYELPADLDLSEVNTVTIFCRSFNVDFGVAAI